MSTATPTARIDSASHPATASCPAARCSNPLHQHHVCWSCLTGLRHDLRELIDTRHAGVMVRYAEDQRAADTARGLLAELEITLTRQNASGGDPIPEPPEEHLPGDGPPAATTVLAFRPIASTTGQHIHVVLEQWTRHLLGALAIPDRHAFPRPVPWGAPGPSVWTAEFAAWLERHPDGIGSHPEAGAIVDDIRGAVEQVRRVVYPARLAYCGPCDCGEQMYATAGASTARCRVCRTRYVVADRLAQLAQQAEGRMLTAEQMAKVLPRIAADIPLRPLTADQIRGYGHRGRLERHLHPDGTRYKLGEVLSLMKQLLDEEVARQARLAQAASATTRDRVLAAHTRFRDALRA